MELPIEQLKRQWTGRRIEVTSDAPTLRRFAGRLGTVVTLNMNCRALVRFDGEADIGWYDIALPDLRIVEAAPAPPEPKPPGEPPVTSATHPAPVQVEATRGAVTPPEPGKRPASILELARKQGAAKRET